LIVDYVDLNNHIIFGMARSREKTYRKLGYEVLNTVNSLIGGGSSCEKESHEGYDLRIE
jgi:hypothetical protein